MDTKDLVLKDYVKKALDELLFQLEEHPKCDIRRGCHSFGPAVIAAEDIVYKKGENAIYIG